MDEIGLSTEDRELIREYLEKPAHARQLEDLIPDGDESGD